MHGRALFPNRESRGYHEGLILFKYQKSGHLPKQLEIKNSHQRQTLDEERPKAEESMHDETRYDALDLRNPRAGRVLGQRSDETSGDEGKCSLFVLFPFRFIHTYASAAHRKK